LFSCPARETATGLEALEALQSCCARKGETIMTYRVHVGGKRYRKFETIDSAKAFCDATFRQSGIVLSIVETASTTKKQARFWTYHNGAVRIKLNAGQTLHHSHGGATDEGYSWEANRYSFDGCMVSLEWHSESRDCDGRMTRGGETVCHVRNLAEGYQEDGIRFPAWEQADEYQRDHSAEVMNY
jgi:hypothetical protein